MARGALVDNGVAVRIFEAAEGLNLNYCCDGAGNWQAFVPDDNAQVGDLWNGSAWTYLQVPQSVTAIQARLALNAAGLRPQVDSAIAAADQTTQDLWTLASVFNRSDPIIASIATALGLSSAQVDALFRSASQIAPP